MSSFGVPAGSQSGIQRVAISGTGRSLIRCDRPTRVYELRFFSTSNIASGKIALTIEGQSVAGGAQVEFPLWQTRVGEGTPGAGSVYIYRPERPFLWSGEMPIEFQSDTACTCLIIGEPVPATR